VILALLFSLLVALFWLKKFRKMDKYEKEPERAIYKAFFAGALATVPSLIFEMPLQMTEASPSFSLRDICLPFLWIAMVEEFFKYLAVRVTVYRSKEFNEVMDGMIYMISASLGFAAAENVGYMIGFGFSVGLLRAILSYLGHLSFSGILGYYLAKSKLEARSNWLYIGFILAISLHFLYNGFLVAGTVMTSGFFIFLGLMVWAFGLLLTFVLLKRAQAVSPFRVAHILPRRLTLLCQVCGKTVFSRSLVCHHCGESLTLDEEEITLKA
jgi:RsiW-degrading membrane proteinase PrsW (M82 family)